MQHTQSHCETRTNNQHRRRGASLFEMMVSAILLSTLFVSVAPVLNWVFKERHEGDSYQIASQELANVMERVSLKNWNDITEDSLQELKISEQTAASLSNPEFITSLKEQKAGLVSKRVLLEISWINGSGKRVSPLRLSAWFYNKQEANH